MSTWDEKYKRNLAAYDEQIKKQFADNDTLHQGMKDSVQSTYEGSIADQNEGYEELSRANEVQKYINAREVAENNANLGLTDSGLNRTQQTAVQLSASNEEARIQRARQSAVEALTREMNSKLADIETSRISSEASIRSGYEQLASDAATETIKAQISAENERIKASESDRKDDLSRLVAHLKENSYDKEYCAKLIDEYAYKYEIDDSSSEMMALLKIPDITLEDLDNAVFGNTSNNDEYIPLQKRNWTVVSNGGVNGFMGLGKLFGNIDDNATVTDGENTYSMAKLSEALQKEGLSKEDAKNWIVWLQKDLGVH